MQNDDEKHDVSLQITSTLNAFRENSNMFKIFGNARFAFEKVQYKNEVDWSGFYTQLTPEHSLRYLTKKWDDGASQACLLTLKCHNSQVRLLTVNHPIFSSPKISGEYKAAAIKNHLSSHYPFLSDLKSHKLLQYLGQNQILLQCIDSQDPEIIIPHNLLTSKHFSFHQLVYFTRSNDGMLRTVSYRFREEQKETKVQSQYQFQPFRLLEREDFDKKLKCCLASHNS